MYWISGWPDNPALDRRLFKNPVPVGFPIEIQPATGFLRTSFRMKTFAADGRTSSKNMNETYRRANHDLYSCKNLESRYFLLKMPNVPLRFIYKVNPGTFMKKTICSFCYALKRQNVGSQQQEPARLLDVSLSMLSFHFCPSSSSWMSSEKFYPVPAGLSGKMRLDYLAGKSSRIS